jgi:coenzyme F420-reducing hydrogenase delta subunit
MQSALSPEWWSDRLDDVLAARASDQALLVLACQRRAGSLEKAFDQQGVQVEVIRFRCVGQIDAGMLLELSRQPFTRVLVAGCVANRCRFTSGAMRAADQLDRAQRMLTSIGLESSHLVADWSSDRAGDRLEPAVMRLTGGH